MPIQTASKVHKAMFKHSNSPHIEYKYKGMYIFGNKCFSKKELIIVKIVKIKNGNGTGTDDIALNTLN